MISTRVNIGGRFKSSTNALLFIGLLIFAQAWAQAPSAPLTLLPRDTAGRCLDGTVSGYYHLLNSTSVGGRKWTISLFGGGECFDKPSCTAHLRDDLGSSNYFTPSVYFGKYAQFASAEQAVSPGFWDWHHVQVPYCSQDLHMGTRSKPAPETWGLYFAGHLIFEAVLTELDKLGMAQAEDILLSGASAGGIGALSGRLCMTVWKKRVGQWRSNGCDS